MFHLFIFPSFLVAVVREVKMCMESGVVCSWHIYIQLDVKMGISGRITSNVRLQ